MRIEVTEDDIQNGNHEANGCPLSLAIERATGAEAWVCHTSIGLFFGKDLRTQKHVPADPPPEAAQFIKDFDDGRPVRPFAFDLEVPA